MAHILVAKEPLAPVEMLVVSISTPKAAALEAVHLYRDRIGARVVLCSWVFDPVDNEIRRLGIPYPRPSELAKTILECGGISSHAIEVLPQSCRWNGDRNRGGGGFRPAASA